MKNIQKITRVQLKINQVDEYFILGLVSAEPDYKLSLALNKKFTLSLKNISPVKINEETQPDLAFSRFSYTNSSTGIVFSLVSNRSGKQYLLRKLKNVDFILQVHDPESETNIDTLTSNLRQIESINAVFNIDLNTFKDKNLHYLTQ